MDRYGIYVMTFLGLLHISGIDEVLGALTSCEYTGIAYNRIQPRDGGEVPAEPISGKVVVRVGYCNDYWRSKSFRPFKVHFVIHSLISLQKSLHQQKPLKVTTFCSLQNVGT